MVSCLVRRVTVVHTHISNPARRVRHRESAAIYSRDLRRDLVVLVTWPGNPEMEGGHWLLTRVMSAFERKYTNAEQNMHSTVPMLHGVLSELARRAAPRVRLAIKGHSMGCYLWLQVRASRREAGRSSIEIAPSERALRVVVKTRACSASLSARESVALRCQDARVLRFVVRTRECYASLSMFI